MTRPDVVVGAGILDASVALHLAEHGHRIAASTGRSEHGAESFAARMPLRPLPMAATVDRQGAP